METSIDAANPTFKQEPPAESSDLPFEQIMVSENNDQYDYSVDDTSSTDSFHESISPNQTFQPPPPKRLRQADQVPPSFQSNGIPTSSQIQELQTQLLRRQIEVQELMAVELKAKIERTHQLMRMDAIESELRCREMKKRLESLN